MHQRTKRSARLGISVPSLLICIACASGGEKSPTAPTGGTPSGTPSANAIVAMNSTDDGYTAATHSFVPNDVYIVRDGTVTWNNATGFVHNVTFGGAAGAPANITGFADGSAVRTFTSSGTFNYSCSIHAGMSGTVRVQ